MNMAYPHLVLNHLPVVALPVVLCFLGYGIWKSQKVLIRVSLVMLVAVCASGIPVYLSGEPAEEAVEHMQGINESAIETHEDVAKVALVMLILTGLAAVGAVLLENKPAAEKRALQAVMLLALIAWVSLVVVANLGGKIHHNELGHLSSEARTFHFS